jgi:hypothetical protein
VEVIVMLVLVILVGAAVGAELTTDSRDLWRPHDGRNRANFV